MDAVKGHSAYDGSLVRSYDVAVFDQYSPKTALDIVNRVPGFSLIEPDEQRGFGQATANVLINGQRVSGKSNGIVQALERMPASSIERVDVHDGAALGIHGLSGEVVDVIAGSDDFAGSWEWEFQHRDHNRYIDPVYWDANVSMTGRQNTTTWTLRLENVEGRLGQRGIEYKTAANNDLLETRDEKASFDRDSHAIKLGLNFAPASGDIGNFSAALVQDWDRDKEQRNSDLPGSRQFERREKDLKFELGGDYEFDFLSGRLKLYGIQFVADTPSTQRARLQEKGVNVRIDEFLQEKDSSESVLRGEYSWSLPGGGELQWTLEGAYNTLDIESSSAAYISNANDTFKRVDADINEQRYEISNSYSLPLTKRLSYQSSLGVEYSRLAQSGDAEQVRYFTRGKGFVALSYAVTPALNASFKIQRSVGQLDFADFIASSDVEDGTTNAGNPDLVPQLSWDYELKLDQSLGELGAISLTIFAEDIEDIVDRIPVGKGDAPGNIDEAERYGAELVTTIDLTRWGWRGASFDLQGLVQKSRVRDPVTGESRRINEDKIHTLDWELRHDIVGSDYAWGITHEIEREAPIFRLNRVTHDVFESDGLYEFYVEHKNIAGMTARFKVRNVTDRTDTLNTVQYISRAAGDVAFTENRQRDFGRYYILVLSGTF